MSSLPVSNSACYPRRLGKPVAVAVATISVIVGLMVWHKRPGTAEESEVLRRSRAAHEAERVLKSMPLVAISEPDSTVLVSRAVSEAVDTHWKARAALLGESVAGFLAARFGGAGPDAYLQAMERAGYGRRDLDELKSGWFIDEAYQAYFGERLPDSGDWDELARKMIVAQDVHSGGRARIVKVASSREGVSVAVKRLTRSDPRWPRLAGAVGDAMDGGPIAISQGWWRPASDHSRMLSEGKEPLVAAVGLVAEMGDGRKRPIAISLHFDESRRAWFVVSVSHGSSSPLDDDALRFEY